MHCQGQLDDVGSVGTLRWVSTAMLAGFPRTQPLCWRLPHPVHVSATLAARLCLPDFSPGWRTFFEEPAMLLGVVLIGRALEERAKLQASADMAALQVGSWGGVGGNGIGGCCCRLLLIAASRARGLHSCQQRLRQECRRSSSSKHQFSRGYGRKQQQPL
jgi:hypothetical protein